MPDFFPRAALDKIALQHGTDKASHGHDFMRFYEFFLQPFRDKEFVLLELGVGHKRDQGKSLFTWRDYFRKAHVVGVDIHANAKDVEGNRIAIEVGDCSILSFLGDLCHKYKPAIIIDDASHRWSHQILALETLFSVLQRGGLYILEDLHTSFGPLRQSPYADQVEDAFTYLARLAHLVSGGGREHPGASRVKTTPALRALAQETDAISFYEGTCVIVKRCGISKGARARAHMGSPSMIAPDSRGDAEIQEGDRKQEGPIGENVKPAQDPASRAGEGSLMRAAGRSLRSSLRHVLPPRLGVPRATRPPGGKA